MKEREAVRREDGQDYKGRKGWMRVREESKGRESRE